MKRFNEKDYLYGILFLFFILCGISFVRYPDLRNEMKYFVVLSEMLQNKEYLILTYLGELYPDKPPIYFWLLGAIKTIFGSNVYPIALIFGGITPLFIGTLFLKKIFKTYLVSLIFLTMLFVCGVSLVLRMDTLMSMFTTISIISLYLAYESYKNSPQSEIKRKYFFGIFGGMALGILVKGGGGIIVPLLTMLCFTYLNNDFKFLKKLKIMKGIGVIFLIISIWFIFIYFSNNGKEYLTLMLGKQTVGRVVNSYTHKRPVYYYLKNIFLTTMPFGIIFFTGICLYIKDFKNRKNWNLLEKLSISWIIPSFLFFSLVSGKLDIYLLPIYPGIAGLIYCFYKKEDWKRYFNVSLKITFVLTALVAFGLLIVSNIPKYGVSIIGKILVIGLFLMTAYFLLQLKKNEAKKDTVPNISIFVILVLVIALYEGKDFNEKTTIKPFQSYLLNIEKNKIKEVVLFKFHDGVNFLEILGVPYENQKEVSELKKTLEKRGNVTVLLREKDLKKLKEFKQDYSYKELLYNDNYYLVKLICQRNLEYENDGL